MIDAMLTGQPAGKECRPDRSGEFHPGGAKLRQHAVFDCGSERRQLIQMLLDENNVARVEPNERALRQSVHEVVAISSRATVRRCAIDFNAASRQTAFCRPTANPGIAEIPSGKLLKKCSSAAAIVKRTIERRPADRCAASALQSRAAAAAERTR